MLVAASRPGGGGRGRRGSALPMAMRPQMTTAAGKAEPALPEPDFYKLDDEIFELRAKEPPPMPTAMAVMEGTAGNLPPTAPLCGGRTVAATCQRCDS